MKIISHTNEGREYLLVEVPTPFYQAKVWFQNMEYLTPSLSMKTDATGFLAYKKDQLFTRAFAENHPFCSVQLPKGYYYRILGLASEVGDDVAGEVVSHADGLNHYFVSYQSGTRSYSNPKDSLASLCRSYSLTPSTTLLIQKI